MSETLHNVKMEDAEKEDLTKCASNMGITTKEKTEIFRIPTEANTRGK